MPTVNQSTLNPNDRSASGKGQYAKKQYSDVNQHYYHHNAVLPVISPTPELKDRSQMKSPVKDPYQLIPEKPNQMSLFQAGQLQSAI